MAKIEGDKVTIEPGFTPEQVIAQAAKLFMESEKRASDRESERQEAARKAFKAYEAAQANYTAALKRQISIYEKALQNIKDKVMTHVKTQTQGNKK